MPRLEHLVESLRSALENVPCPTYDDPAWVNGPPLSERRVAIISTAALQKREEQSFALGDAEYRVIPGDLDTSELVMSHVSTNFDRTGFLQDVNLVFPIERLRELLSDGVIGSIAKFHYSFMGATPPTVLEAVAKNLAGILKSDNVDGVVLAGV